MQCIPLKKRRHALERLILPTIVKYLDIDRAVLCNLLARGWSVAVGILTIYFISLFVSPVLQGYYYTFNSLIALQIFVELGLNFAIVQFASHEMPQLAWQLDGTLNGSEPAKRRLQSLLRFALVWFGIAAVLMIGILMPVGMLFFTHTAHTDIPVSSIAWPWLMLVTFTALNLLCSSILALLEGCGEIHQIALLKLWQALLTGIASLLALRQGFALYALVANSALLFSMNFLWLWIKHKRFLVDLLKFHSQLPGMSWKHEIWPFQSKIAMSWISGYFLFNLFTPLLFASHGSKVAGQMGISMQICSTLNNTAMVWISTKMPKYGQLIAKGQRQLLDRLFFRALLISFSFLLASLLLISGTIYYLATIDSFILQRVLPLPLLGILGIICLANHVVFAEAAYLRAHKQEPFMVLSVVNAIITACLAIKFIPLSGSTGAVMTYAVATIIIGLLGGTFIFLKKRQQWQALTINNPSD